MSKDLTTRIREEFERVNNQKTVSRTDAVAALLNIRPRAAEIAEITGKPNGKPYGRHVAFAGEKVEVLLVNWQSWDSAKEDGFHERSHLLNGFENLAPDDVRRLGTAPHDHGRDAYAVVHPAKDSPGQVHEVLYKEIKMDGTLKAVKSRVHTQGAFAYTPSHAIHSASSDGRGAQAVHVYAGDPHIKDSTPPEYMLAWNLAKGRVYTIHQGGAWLPEDFERNSDIQEGSAIITPSYKATLQYARPVPALA